MYSSLYSLLWQCVLAYEAGRLLVCWNGSKISKNILPTTLAALAWLGGAVFLVKQGYLLGRFYVLILTSVAMAICAGLWSWKANGKLGWVKNIKKYATYHFSCLALAWWSLILCKTWLQGYLIGRYYVRILVFFAISLWIHKVGQVSSFRYTFHEPYIG